MIGLVCFLIGALAPIVLLGPLAGKVTQRVVFKRPAPSEAEPREQPVVVRAWKPLDLGVDPVRWPSEAPRVLPHFPEPGWPSEGWNDPHFGKKRGGAPPPTRPASPSPAAVARPAGVQAAAARAEAEFMGEPEPVAGGSERLGGLTDDQVRGLVEREGLVKAVEILVSRGGFDAGTVARELRRILADGRGRQR